MVATQGDIGCKWLSPIWRGFPSQHLLLLMVCFWRLSSTTLGTVCTYICRNNVYVSQNRHFLKAVNLKVKLIEPIFSAHLLTLLMCMLNRRSQIWVSLAKRPESASGYIQSWGSLANSTLAVKMQIWRRCSHFLKGDGTEREEPVMKPWNKGLVVWHGENYCLLAKHLPDTSTFPFPFLLFFKYIS